MDFPRDNDCGIGRGRGKHRLIKYGDLLLPSNEFLELIKKEKEAKRIEAEGAAAEKAIAGLSIAPQPTAMTDVDKPLSQIIKERGIPKPSKYGPSENSPRKSTAAVDTATSPCKSEAGTSDASPKRKSRKIKLRNIDPTTNALSDMIDHGQDEQPSTSNSCSKRKRPAKDDNGPRRRIPKVTYGAAGEGIPEVNHIVTPFRAVNDLSTKGIMLDYRIGQLQEAGNKDRRWRCIVSSGDIKGICESERKTLAREIASHQFMQNLKEYFPNQLVPAYDIPDELFIDPKVSQLLEQECNKGQIPLVFATNVVAAKNNERYGRVYPVYTYKCTYIVGENMSEFFAFSSDEKFAKTSAAKKAYEFVTGESFEPTAYYVDEMCDQSLEHDFNESFACMIIDKE